MTPCKPLKVAVVVKRLVAHGGAERYAAETAGRLAARGHRIDVYTRHVDGPIGRGLNPVLVPDRLRFSSVLNLYAFYRDSSRLLTPHAYDVVHSHERGHRADISTVHTFCYLKGSQTRGPLRRAFSVDLSWRSRLHLWLEKRQMQSTLLAAVSQSVAADIDQHYGRRQVVVIGPGVDHHWFHPAWLAANRQECRRREALADQDLAILFVGSEFRRKGLDDLIRAIGPGMRLIVAGQGERWPHYRELARGCQPPGAVVFKGMVPDVRPLYAAADVLVLPSLREAFGMSVLEAMACGLAVVVRAGAGVAALIQDGFNGMCIEDATGLAAVLARLKDPALRRRLGHAARRTAEGHTWDRVADRYEGLYYRIAGDRAKGKGRG
jgi:UDP-glucose:(heptosyl)LPS alpha-1,3-glucosyltransferase